MTYQGFAETKVSIENDRFVVSFNNNDMQVAVIREGRMWITFTALVDFKAYKGDVVVIFGGTGGCYDSELGDSIARFPTKENARKKITALAKQCAFFYARIVTFSSEDI